jgi:hypothetical protein
MPNTNCLEGIACPQCKQEDRFNITATIVVEVSDSGTGKELTGYEWDLSSHCTRTECEYTGTLKDFTTKPETKNTRYDIETLKAYDEYFDACEKANKIPLSFDKWKTAHSQNQL